MNLSGVKSLSDSVMIFLSRSSILVSSRYFSLTPSKFTSLK